MAKMRNSVITEGFAGSAGSATFRSSVVGQQLTVRTTPRDARTDSQIQSRADFTEGSDGYGGLTAGQKAAWASAAKSSTRRDPVTRKSYALRARAMFIGLASKFAQVNPGQALPTLPPATKYKGDTIGVNIDVNGSTATLTATAANNVSSTTEILVARLASVDRAPQEGDYVTYGFHRFTAGPGLTTTVSLSPGHWAIGYKFVCPQTGEEKMMRPLGTFLMGLAMVSGGLDEGEAAKAA